MVTTLVEVTVVDVVDTLVRAIKRVQITPIDTIDRALTLVVDVQIGVQITQHLRHS